MSSLKKTMLCSNFNFSSHAVNAMISRNIPADDVVEVIEFGEVIADYPNDKPYPSKLLLNFINGIPIHAVVAQHINNDECIVITCYFPDASLWDNDFKTKINNHGMLDL